LIKGRQANLPVAPKPASPNDPLVQLFQAKAAPESAPEQIKDIFKENEKQESQVIEKPISAEKRKKAAGFWDILGKKKEAPSTPKVRI
jgi:hypothetical protein